MKTSDAVRLSSCLGPCLAGGWECGGLVVFGACSETEVQAAEESPEQVARADGVPVADLAPPVVVVAGAGWCGDGGERSDVADGGQPLVLDPAVQDGPGFAGGAGDGRGSGVALESFSIGEAGSVLADLGETRAPVSGPSPGKLVMIPASGCWLKDSLTACSRS
jgi:hypothetical protein